MQRLIVIGIMFVMGLGFAGFIGNFVYSSMKKPTPEAPAATGAATAANAAAPSQKISEDRPAVVAPNAVSSLMLDIAQAGPQKLVAVGERGRIIHSEDFGSNWTQAESVPSRTTLTGVAFANEQTGWAVGHDAVILATSDGGIKWNRQYRDAALAKPLLDIVALDAGRAVAVGAYGLILSTNDGGNSWQTRGMGDVNTDDLHLNAILRLPGGRLVIAGEAGPDSNGAIIGHIYLSDDDAGTWRDIKLDHGVSLFGLFTSGDAVYATGLKGRLLRSTDRGETWQTIKTGSDAVLMSGTALDKDNYLAVGTLGTMIVGNGTNAQPKRLNRNDRLAMSGALSLKDGTIVLIGEHGPIQVKSSSDLSVNASVSEGK